MERSGFDPDKDRLISLGDITDYNPENVRLIDRLMDIPNFISVRGNHDTMVLDYLRTGFPSSVWHYNGGIQTRSELDQLSREKRAAYLEFFENQLRYFIDEENRLYVHAGFDHTAQIDGQSDEILYWGRKLWMAAKRSEMFGEEFPENEFKEVFIGHTQTAKSWPDCLPKHFGNIWNLDQGAKEIGRLTIMDVATKEFWQSDPTKELYPETV